jgi:tetratricopeptide (TPR) repeat protein
MTVSQKHAAPLVRSTQTEASRAASLPEVIPLLRAAIAAGPRDDRLRLQLAKALFHTNRFAELVSWLQPLQWECEPTLLCYLGQAARLVGDSQLSESALRRAVAQGQPEATGYLVETLMYAGDRDEALALALMWLGKSPQDFRAQRAAASELLRRNEKRKLWNLCADLRCRGVWGSYVPSSMAFAASSPIEEQQIADLVNPLVWVEQTRFDDHPKFNMGLEADLRALGPGVTPPATKSTIGAATRLDGLERADGAFLRELRGRILRAVDTYVARRVEFPGNPLIAQRPATIALRIWSINVQGSGYETWHIHPAAWLSGVYYLRTPSREGARMRGAITFGPLPLGTVRKMRAWPAWTLIPAPGVLLLFPSYFGHRTWPTGVSEPRISIAFDVLAVEASTAKDIAL